MARGRAPDDSRPEPLKPVRHLVPVVLAVAALLAAVLVVLASRPGDGGEAPAPTGPAVRLADRAGLITVAMAARADSLQFTLMQPEIDADPPAIRDVAVGTAGGPLTPVETGRCGDDCLLARTTIPQGEVTVRVRVAFADRTDTARFRFPWPLPSDASALLGRADERTRGLRRVVVRERVTSDPRGGFFTNPTRTMSGDLLAGTLGAVGAQDPRELPAPGPLRRVAYALPAAPMWIELWIGPDGVVRRGRIVGPKHLLHRTFTPR